MDGLELVHGGEFVDLFAFRLITRVVQVDGFSFAGVGGVPSGVCRRSEVAYLVPFVFASQG